MSTVEPDAADDEHEPDVALVAPVVTSQEKPTKWFARWWKVASATAVFAAALITVVAYFVPPGGTEPTAEGSTSEQRSPSAGGEDGDLPAPGGIASGRPDVHAGSNCLDASGGGITCDGPHSHEVVEASTDCSASALLAYLGGDEDVDVLRPGSGSSVVQVSGMPTCTVTSPDGGTMNSSAQDALRGPTGDPWRWCLAQENDASIGCSTAHDREVIGPTDAEAGALDCSTRADLYLEVPLRNHDRQLYVTSEQVDGAQRCIIGVRGDNRLTASLRRLRSSTLPITAS